MARRRRHLRWALYCLLLLLLLGASFVLYMGWDLAAPANRGVGAAPEDFPAETVRIPSGTGSELAGWFRESTTPPRGMALLMHGIRSDRRSMMGRAKFLHQAGFHVLAIDLQAHGESPGEHITMGHVESLNSAAAAGYLRQRYPGLRLVVVGSSLGGVAALRAPYDRPPEAMIVEAVFADVDTAVGNRLAMRLGEQGRRLSPLLTLQAKWLLHLDLAEISPVEAAKKVTWPVLVMHGEYDKHAALSEGRAIYDNLAGAREFWTVRGAAHVNLHRFDPEAYEARTLSFLNPLFPPAP